jgi:hypothetical protein
MAIFKVAVYLKTVIILPYVFVATLKCKTNYTRKQETKIII